MTRSGVSDGAPAAIARAPLLAPPVGWVALGLSACVFLVSFASTRNTRLLWAYEHLGAEYFNVAQALVDGRGFSDPFAEATGPTAWVPPTYPALLALLLLIFETKAAVATAVITLTNLSLVATGVILYVLSKRISTCISPLFVVGIHVAWILVFQFSFFVFTHDVWLVACVVAVMLFLLADCVLDSRVSGWRWGLLAGATTLVSPSLAFAFGVTALGLFLREPRHRKSWLLAGLVATLVAAPWVTRNALVFGRFIPTKSNLGFELYQANVTFSDGIYDNRSFVSHPHHDPNSRFEYARLGEQRFIAMHRERFEQTLRANPGDFVRRVGNRIAASTLLLPDYGPVSRESSIWLRRVVFACPLLVLLGCLRRHARHRSLLCVLGLLWGAYLVPYVTVAVYARYLMPLSPLLVLVLGLGLDEVLPGSRSFLRAAQRSIRWRRSSSSVSSRT